MQAGDGGRGGTRLPLSGGVQSSPGPRCLVSGLRGPTLKARSPVAASGSVGASGNETRSNYWLWESEPYVEASGWILDFGRLQPRLLCRWGRVELGGRAASRGQQVTVDLKSKQHPMRESSAPAIPPFCSQPPLPLYRLKETTLQSAAEASPSSELREDAVWWRQREKCQTIEGLCGSPWGWCPDIGDSSDPGGRCCPQLGLRVCPSAPWTGKSGCRGGPALLQPRALLVPAWSAPAEVLGQGGERCEDQGNGCLN